VNPLNIPQETADAILWVVIGMFLAWGMVLVVRGIYDGARGLKKFAHLAYECRQGRHSIVHLSHQGRHYVACKRPLCSYREWENEP
jgi:hypothetical protein